MTRHGKAGRLSAAAGRLLALAAGDTAGAPTDARQRAAIADLIAADLATCDAAGRLRATEAGRAHLRRQALARAGSPLDPFRAQHLELSLRRLCDDDVTRTVLCDDAESPLLWLARRKGRDGRPLIGAAQFQAGERLRADFTRANAMPRVTANWEAPVAPGARGAGSPAHATEAMVAARQRLHRALDVLGPEFAGLLMDVCCFLKRLDDVERERGWPPRACKVVLQLGLDRLARHYGYADAARGCAQVPIQRWSAEPEAVTPVD